MHLHHLSTAHILLTPSFPIFFFSIFSFLSILSGQTLWNQMLTSHNSSLLCCSFQLDTVLMKFGGFDLWISKSADCYNGGGVVLISTVSESNTNRDDDRGSALQIISLQRFWPPLALDPGATRVEMLEEQAAPSKTTCPTFVTLKSSQASPGGDEQITLVFWLRWWDYVNSWTAQQTGCESFLLYMLSFDWKNNEIQMKDLVIGPVLRTHGASWSDDGARK